MTRRVFDCFPFHDELDILEMRLTELQDVPNLVHVLVEANVSHTDKPKPSHFRDNADRFAPWKDRIVHVWAVDLPTVREDPGPWAREVAQRERIAVGLIEAECENDDIVLQSDVDEIPTAIAARLVEPRGGFVSFGQRGHFWAVDWLYYPDSTAVAATKDWRDLPGGWCGTVAAEARSIPRIGFGGMRNTRNLNPNRLLRGCGWHFSWLGGPDRALAKVQSFCHPEVKDRIVEAVLDGDRFWRNGIHTDGVAMIPVDVDRSWPKFITEGRCPPSWFRPR